MLIISHKRTVIKFLMKLQRVFQYKAATILIIQQNIVFQLQNFLFFIIFELTVHTSQFLKQIAKWVEKVEKV